MKKIGYLFGLILLIALPEILSAQLPKGIRVPTGENTDNLGLGVPDQNCNVTYTFTVVLYNLDLVNGLDYSNWQPSRRYGITPPSSLSLPTHYDPMYLNYTYGNQTGTIFISDFNYVHTPSGANMFIFSHSVTINISNECDGTSPTYLVTVPHSYALETTNGAPYPVCNHLSAGDIFDCNYFEVPICFSRRIPLRCDNDYLTTNGGDGTMEIACGASCAPYDHLNGPGNGRSSDHSEELFNNKLAVEIMPNPFDTYLTIKWNKETIHPIIRLYDASGRMIRTWQNKSYNENEAFQADTNDLSKGIYFLHIQNGKESTYEKVIKS